MDSNSCIICALKYTVNKVVKAATLALLHLRIMTLHGASSKGSKSSNSHSSRSRKIISIQAELAESDVIQTVDTQAVNQAATAAVILMREADARPTTGTNTFNSGEAPRHGHGWPALRQPYFNWNAPDKYVEFLSFEMEVLKGEKELSLKVIIYEIFRRYLNLWRMKPLCVLRGIPT